MQALQFEHSFAKSDAVTCPWQPGKFIGSPVIAIPLPPKFKESYWSGKLKSSHNLKSLIQKKNIAATMYFPEGLEDTPYKYYCKRIYNTRSDAMKPNLF